MNFRADNRVIIWYSRGDGTFHQISFVNGLLGNMRALKGDGKVLVLDADGDTLSDIVVLRNDSTIQFWLGNGLLSSSSPPLTFEGSPFANSSKLFRLLEISVPVARLTSSGSTVTGRFRAGYFTHDNVFSILQLVSVEL